MAESKPEIVLVTTDNDWCFWQGLRNLYIPSLVKRSKVEASSRFLRRICGVLVLLMVVSNESRSSRFPAERVLFARSRRDCRAAGKPEAVNLANVSCTGVKN